VARIDALDIDRRSGALDVVARRIAQLQFIELRQ
jgi:hypothetical protein